MSIEFSDRELDAMEILWERGSCTVREAKESIDKDLAYTSVLSVFQTLEDKGHVTHEEEGRAYRYYPLVSREDAQEDALGRIVQRFFEGSRSAALTTLLAGDSLDEEVLERAREELGDEEDEE